MNMVLNNMKLQENIHRIMGLMNESSTSHYRTYYDEDEVNRFEKILNKSMKKYDWWKDIKIDLLSYDERPRMLIISAVLSVDEEWGAGQWREFYYEKSFPSNDTTEVGLGDIIDSDFAYKLRDDISNMFEFTFGKAVDTLSLNNIDLKFIPTQDIPENIQEQETSRKDLSPMIEKLLESIKNNYPGIVCDIEVTAPWNREATEFDESFEDYEILITFVGGYGSNRWPNTQAISSQNEDVMNEVWDLVYNVFNLTTDMYSKDNPRC